MRLESEERAIETQFNTNQRGNRDLQLNPAITDAKDPMMFISYWRIAFIAINNNKTTNNKKKKLFFLVIVSINYM